MAIITYHEKDEEQRQEALKRLLPKQSLVETELYPVIQKKLYGTIARLIRTELEIYRKYPKRNKKESTKEKKKTFDPRNNKSCFMGKAFKQNDSLTDNDLANYRNAIGTVDHPTWGNCTLLEIWAGDHYKDYPKMVKAAFSYGYGTRAKMPSIKIHINPLINNPNSGKAKLDKEQKEEKEAREELFARALVFGVKTAAKARKSRRR